MRLIKPILLIVFTMSLSLPLNAQVDSKQQLMQRLATLQSFTADFEQVVTDAQSNIVHQASGEIALAQPNKLRWHTKVPDEIMLIANGSDVYQVDFFVEQVSIISQSDAVNNNPMMLLTSNVQSDWDQFEVATSVDGFVITALKEGPITSLTLVFENGMLSKIVSIDSQEQKSQLAFANQAENVPLGLDTFKPLMPEGFIIDDQRP